MKRSVEERLWSKVHMPDLIWNPHGCWEWIGARSAGYGVLKVDGKNVHGHQLTYRLICGAVPEGLELDHLCRNRACVNPFHLEPVTHQENMARGESGAYNLVKTHCPRGHPYAGDNLRIQVNGSRMCRACGRERAQQFKAANRERINARRRQLWRQRSRLQDLPASSVRGLGGSASEDSSRAAQAEYVARNYGKSLLDGTEDELR